MNVALRLVSLGFSLTAALTGLAAEGVTTARTQGDDSLVVISRPLPPAPAPRRVEDESHTIMRERLGALVRQDANATAPFGPPEPAAEAPAARSGEIIELERMTVHGKKIEVPPPRHETPVQEFFRTGTLWSTRDGRMKLWMKGDQGLMFTFAW